MSSGPHPPVTNDQGTTVESVVSGSSAHAEPSARESGSDRGHGGLASDIIDILELDEEADESDVGIDADSDSDESEASLRDFLADSL